MTGYKPAEHILDEFLSKHAVRCTVSEFTEVLDELRASIGEEIAVMLEAVPGKQAKRITRAAARMTRDYCEADS